MTPGRIQLDALVAERIQKAVTKALAERDEAHKAEIAELQKNFDARLEEFASEPDPNKAPHRGTSVVVAAPTESAAQKALRGERQERIAWLERMADRHPNPATREIAWSRLLEEVESASET